MSEVPSKRPDYEARRDAFFARTRRTQPQPALSPDNSPVDPPKPVSPAPASDAATAQDAPAGPKPRPDYEARRDAFFARTRGRNRGPVRETPEAAQEALKKVQEANPLNQATRNKTAKNIR